MPIKDFDALAKELFEPIDFTMDGKKYRVGKVTANLVMELTKKEDGKEDEEIGRICGLLASMVGAKPETFLNSDIRSVTAAIQYVTEEATKQMGEAPKNSPKDAVKPS